MLVRIIEQQRKQQEALDELQPVSFDQAAEPMANVFAAMFVLLCPDDDTVKKQMRLVGFELGRIFFLMNRAKAAETDRVENRYNVFTANGLTGEAAVNNAVLRSEEASRRLLNEFNMIDIKQNLSLARNILAQGVQASVNGEEESIPQERGTVL